MQEKRSRGTPPQQALARFALRLEGADESVACAGTALEKRTVRVRGKAFVFLGARDVLLKLGESLPEARALAKAEPGRFRAGSGGWVTIRVDAPDPPPLALLERWVRESHALLAAAPAKPRAGKAARGARSRRS